ncbi:MAG: hypothetical protein NZ774_00610 [Candidatus Poseidoniales archaeon]|nr:hypothetical protein [Candidatus Poseidoniales archaeon]
MDEQQRPLLTMCKSRIIEDIPVGLSEKSLTLLQTLSSLCSFYSAADLAGFLFSEMFDSLVGNDEPWIVFELGIYRDQNKTIELIAVAGNITLADTQSLGVFDDDVVQCKTVEEMENFIIQWHDAAYDNGGRFQ